ncbi:hypothetical protein F2P81_022016 [Scophthalmus maximus]|uniref:Uncharacterized protein n=1 Tax=Scophthalmus maximus TaxID=52904 RepID=A0A6A4RYL9_SCOMX|nr:hypothetical protein F2P81_022016 [Scophthalmus maximus]
MLSVKALIYHRAPQGNGPSRAVAMGGVSVTQRAVRDDSSAERTQPNPMHGFTDKCKTARDLEKSLFSTLSTDLLRSEGNTGPSHNKIEEKERRSQSKALKVQWCQRSTFVLSTDAYTAQGLVLEPMDVLFWTVALPSLRCAVVVTDDVTQSGRVPAPAATRRRLLVVSKLHERKLATAVREVQEQSAGRVCVCACVRIAYSCNHGVQTVVSHYVEIQYDSNCIFHTSME